MNDFEGRVVVITGGASGMGAASVQVFAARGARVVIIDRDEARAATVAAQVAIDAGDDRAIGVRIGDVSDPEFCRTSIDEIAESLGSIDVLVNCAGTIHRAGAAGTSDDDWRRVMGVNVDGVFFMSRAVIPHMQRAGGGAIVNFGSIWGQVGSTGTVAYCASKGAVHQLTRAMALDHATEGIRVNAVAPGEVNTPMLASHRDHAPSPEELQALADSTIPMKRLAEPHEIAEMVAFLASDAASYMTGAIVPVDAGYTAR